MNKFHIFGLGSAILDTEVSVSDQVLKNSNVIRGTMTLVDENQQEVTLRLLSKQSKFLAQSSGGSICNSLVAASNLGAKVFFNGKIGNDKVGDMFMEDLQFNNVDFFDGERIGKTGRCLVMITPDAQRTMQTCLGDQASLFLDDVDYAALKDSEWLFIEGYLLSDSHSCATIESVMRFAKRHGVKIALGLSDSLLIDRHYAEFTKIITAGIDLIFCNKEEAFSLSRTKTLPEAFSEMQNFSKYYVLTDGEKGAYAFDGSELVYNESISVEAIDTNGAGDIFAGAFLYSISHGKSFPCAIELSNFCASIIVTNYSARLKKDDFDRIKSKFYI